MSLRTAVNNPFSPGSDTVPQVWAGRTDQLTDWTNVVRPRRISGLPERGRTILGEAGLGKSSLVGRIAGQAEREGDWVTPQLRIPSGTDPLKAVATAALKLADRAGLATAREHRIGILLDRVRAIAASGVSLTIDKREGPEPYSALTDLLVEIGRAAIVARVAVLVHVDEIQNISDANVLSQLLISLGDVITHEVRLTAPGRAEIVSALPIAVYLTGLPDFADMASARRGATFARRFATTTLGPLADDDLAVALRSWVTDGWEVPDDEGGVARIWMTPDAASKIIDVCRGEPFLFQLAGERAWYAGDSDVISEADVVAGWTTARTEAVAHVERILDRLPPRERQLLEGMASLGPPERTLTNIAKQLGIDDGAKLGPIAQRLDTVRGIIDRGRPYAFRHRAVEAYLTTDWPRI